MATDKAESATSTVEAVNQLALEEPEQPVREISQTDHVNQKLLSSFLDKVKDKKGSEILAMFTNNSKVKAADHEEDEEEDWNEDDDDEEEEEEQVEK